MIILLPFVIWVSSVVITNIYHENSQHLLAADLVLELGYKCTGIILLQI